MALDIEIDYWFSDEWCDYYVMDIYNARGELLSIGVIIDCGDGRELDVWSNDSGLWYTWEWRGDHYEKVGGSRAQRTYYPAS